jgi:hypothetical protein
MGVLLQPARPVDGCPRQATCNYMVHPTEAYLGALPPSPRDFQA